MQECVLTQILERLVCVNTALLGPRGFTALYTVFVDFKHFGGTL